MDNWEEPESGEELELDVTGYVSQVTPRSCLPRSSPLPDLALEPNPEADDGEMLLDTDTSSP
jgi:hypothetical protein